MNARQRRALAELLTETGELLREGMSAAEVATMIAAADRSRLDAGTRASLEPAIENEGFAAEIPMVLASAVGARSEAWVRAIEEPRRKGEALLLLSEELVRRRRTSSIVTLIVFDIVVLAIVSLVYAFAVSPVWDELLRDMGATLPMPTLVAIHLGQILAFALIAALIVALILRIAPHWRLAARLAGWVDRFLRRIPAVAPYFRIRDSVRWARWLAVGGLAPRELAEAMAEAGVGTARSRSAAALADELARHPVSEAMSRTGRFLPGLVNLVRTLEQRGAAADWRPLLTRYASATAGREEAALDRLLLAAHAVTGVLVGVFVFGFYLPIFKIGAAV
jgi:type II secretory pathway component PulF